MHGKKHISKSTKAIALFGGTFDPIHKGHIECAKHVTQWLGLTQVSLVPSHIPPHKSSTTVSARDRLAMVKLAIEDDPLFTIDDREILKKTTSYTVETLEELVADKAEKKVYFIIGMDSLIHFTKWHRWQDILRICHIVVSTRPGYEITATPEELEPFIENELSEITNQTSGKILIAPPCLHDISSTEIRHLLASEKTSGDQIPDAVSQYIKKNNLYTT